MESNQVVASGKVVTVHYKLQLDNGQVVDSSEGGDPMAYLHGAGHIVPGLERALEGIENGTKVKVSVNPEDAYGHRHDDNVQDVERSAFPTDAELDTGVTFQARDENGNPILGTITAVEAESITVDFNHPLAGLNLHFDVEIVEIRDATDEEREHGHAHGPGGHDH